MACLLFKVGDSDAITVADHFRIKTPPVVFNDDIDIFLIVLRKVNAGFGGGRMFDDVGTKFLDHSKNGDFRLVVEPLFQTERKHVYGQFIDHSHFFGHGLYGSQKAM